MNYFFFDASALIKRYRDEPGSEVVNALLDTLLPHSPERVSLSPLGLVEVIAALNRKKNEGKISSHVFQQAVARLLLETRTVDVQPVNDESILAAISYVIRHNINASDGLYLHQALTLQGILQVLEHNLVLVAADRRLLRAAAREGIHTLDPESVSIVEARAQLT